MLIGVTLGVHAAASMAPYEVRGTAEDYNYLAAEQVARKIHVSSGHDFTPVVSNAVSFVCAVSNSCWKIRVTDPGGTSPFSYREAAFDGQTLYQVSYFRQENTPASSEGNVASAWIFDNQQVIYDIFNHHMGPIWLAAASGHYFVMQTNDLVEPATILGLFEIQEFYKRPFKQHAHWTLQRDFPQLPTRVVYLDDGEVKTDPQFEPYPRQPPFNRGFTNVVYRVTDSTNFNGSRVPLTGVLDTFRPDVWDHKSELVHYTRYRIHLLHWTTNAGPTLFRPRLPGLTLISDVRVFGRTGWTGSRSRVYTNWPPATNGE